MKTRILILAALAAALLSCSGPAVEGRWKDDASSEEDGQMTAVFEINPDGNVRILIDTKETYETLGVFTASTVMPGTWTLNKKTLTIRLDNRNAQYKFDFEPNSVVGLLGDMAIDGFKKEMAESFKVNMDSVIVFQDVKVSKDKMTYTESGQAGSATRLPDPTE